MCVRDDDEYRRTEEEESEIHYFTDEGHHQ